MEGAIFDLDGTLLDSMSIWDTVGEKYLRSIGYEPKENLNETLKTMSLRQAAWYYITEYGVSLSMDEIIDGVNKMICRYYTHQVELKPGVDAFLNDLYKNGIKMCIATATDRSLVEEALRRCGVFHYFSEIFTCTSIGHGKDSPMIYREALKHLGTDKLKTVVFEDAIHAIKTAKSDGFITIGVYDEYEKAQDEMKLFADFTISDYKDMDAFWKLAESF